MDDKQDIATWVLVCVLFDWLVGWLVGFQQVSQVSLQMYSLLLSHTDNYHHKTVLISLLVLFHVEQYPLFVYDSNITFYSLLLDPCIGCLFCLIDLYSFHFSYLLWHIIG